MKAFALLLLALLTGCASVKLPHETPQIVTAQEATQGQQLLDLGMPAVPLSIGIYSCVDTTGQRKKSVPGTSDFSSAVPQDCTPFMIAAARSLPKHYRVLERSNVDTVLRERQLAAAMLGEKSREQLGNLTVAEILIYGQIVSYDRTTSQSAGGLGVSALGVARERVSDTFTFSIRAVSTKTGEVLHEVIVRKTLESVQANGHVLRVYGTNLASAEYGSAANESAGMALQEAINLALRTLTQRGLRDNWWS